MTFEGWLSLVGTVVTVVAFGLTIIQLRKTASATSAANEAISGLRSRIGTFDVVAECLRASKSLQHAIKLIRMGGLPDAADILFEVQASLNRVRLLDQANSMITEEMINKLLDMISEIEDAGDKNLKFSSPDTIIYLRKLINTLDQSVISGNRKLIDG